MQSVSAALATAATAWPRNPRYKVEVQWDGVNWTDETQYLREMSGRVEIGGSEAGTAAIGSGGVEALYFTLNNPDGRFSARRTDGALYAHIGGNGGYGKRVRASVGFVVAGGGVEYVQVFTGHLKEPRELLRPAMVSFQALGLSSRAATQRVSTALQANTRADQYIEMLAQMLDPAPAATLTDTGLDVYPFLWADDESIWSEMARVAEAEGGRVFYDAQGNLKYWNFLHLLQNSAVTATLLADGGFKSIIPEYDYGAIWNHIIVRYRHRFVAGLQNVWESSESIAVPPGATIYRWAQLQTACYDIEAPISGTDWTARTSSYIDKTADVTVTIPAAGAADRYAQRVKLTITNSNPTHQLYVDGLQLRGYPVLVTEERAAEAADATSIAAHGERVKEVDNVYVESEEAAVSLAQSMLYRFKNPRQIVRLVGVRGLPYQELGDRVHVDDSLNTGIHGDYFVSGIEWRCKHNLYEQDLTLMDAAAVSPYGDYFIIGSTALGAVGRAFY